MTFTTTTLKIFICKYHSRFLLALTLSYVILVSEFSHSDAYAMEKAAKAYVMEKAAKAYDVTSSSHCQEVLKRMSVGPLNAYDTSVSVDPNGKTVYAYKGVTLEGVVGKCYQLPRFVNVNTSVPGSLIPPKN